MNSRSRTYLCMPVITMKFLKIRTPENYCNYPTAIRLEDADGMANSVDPDQTAQEQSDLGLQSLPRFVCLKS